MRHSVFVCAWAAAMSARALAQSGLAYDEAAQGDLSTDNLHPTALVLGPGSSTITGTIGRSPEPDVPDRDYVTLTVPAGQMLTHLNLLQVDVGGAFSFIGVARGPVIPFDWLHADPSQLLGWTHFGGAMQGVDLLPAIGIGGGSQGFEPPLSPGEYTFWFMELDTFTEHPYEFEFIVEEAPCRADYNADGAVNSTDVSDLINVWFEDQAEGTLLADFDLDGVSNSTDVSDFINAWFEEQGGC